ncbi:efflux RND transporter periplasmic adaptor subunit [Nitratiruptor tergarcus]|uniref:RND family efflux transporter, MFP subunit n=1 Tax=Nitratiruptor tergarcus DSM 16512 TaxID=1069081 RepID=A0A1W1WSX2_9BACT|nr:efflux RND transporter periplasmic adaptor subunit [Nitratiruptor tergarcus]SMC09336.1 RND family efflux transporter, MFP subunit [Nitratiruptor tergarcus DSM 16512]
MKNIVFAMLFALSLYAEGLSLSGTVISDDTKMLGTRYMGFVKKVYKHEGDWVKKGEVLYVIDSKEIDLAKSQVELMISQARLAIAMNNNMYMFAKTNYERHKRLFAKGMVSKFELERMELMYKNTKDMVQIAKKQLQMAKAKLAEVLHQYEYLKIKAPNDGVIIQNNVKEGQLTIPGYPGMILTTLDNLKVMAEISESNLKNVKIGQKVAVYIPSLAFEAEGRVTSIIPAANPMTHKFKIKVSFKNPNKATIIPGMYAKLDFK